MRRIKAAYLGYAYPPKIHRKESHVFYAYVTIVDSELLIRSRLKSDAASTEGKEAEGDTIIVHPKNIAFYKSIHLSLTDPAGDFKITPIQFSDTQTINLYAGTRWQWTFYTETDKQTAKLFLKAEGLRSEGVSDDLDDRVIPISVLIQTNVLRSYYLYLVDHWAITAPAIFAFLLFLYWAIKRIFGAKGDEEE